MIARSRARSCAASMASRTTRTARSRRRTSRPTSTRRREARRRPIRAGSRRAPSAPGRRIRRKIIIVPIVPPPTLTSKLTSHHDHAPHEIRGTPPPPGPTPGAYLAGRHTKSLSSGERGIASGRKTLARHFELRARSPVRAGLQKGNSESTPAPGASHHNRRQPRTGQPISTPGASRHNQGQPLTGAAHHI